VIPSDTCLSKDKKSLHAWEDREEIREDVAEDNYLRVGYSKRKARILAGKEAKAPVGGKGPLWVGNALMLLIALIILAVLTLF